MTRGTPGDRDVKDAYTVRISRPDGTTRFEGDFRSYGAAEIRARELADRARVSEILQVHRGRRDAPGGAVGPVFRSSPRDSSRDFDKRELMLQIDREQRAAARAKSASMRSRLK